MSFIVNGNELPHTTDWRVTMANAARVEHNELTSEKDGSMRQIAFYDDGTVIETILGKDGGVVMTINRDVAFDYPRGLILVLEPGTQGVQDEDGSVRVIATRELKM